MRRLVAVVDDEPDIVEAVSIPLKKANFSVRGFTAAGTFLRFLDREKPDLVILDLMLPDMDGMEICKFMKRDYRLAAIPIIMLSARADEADRVLGLELGADDYVTKPFSARELVARVKAVLRRDVQRTSGKVINVGGILAIDLEKHEVDVRGRRVNLTATEFRILALLSSRSGKVFSRDEILDHLWGHDKAVVDRTVDVHIRNLREKLGKGARLVRNVRGVGYKLES